MIRKASSFGIPWPKKAGADPTPPKFPQPRITCETETPLRPSSRCSTRAILRRLCRSRTGCTRDPREQECAHERGERAGEEHAFVAGHRRDAAEPERSYGET